MSNHHGVSTLPRLGRVLRIWRQRAAGRRELARWTERDLNDVGLTRDDIELEIAKPFWRA
jgi:uncharacterized protein YjiS (DUF1127 family)